MLLSHFPRDGHPGNPVSNDHQLHCDIHIHTYPLKDLHEKLRCRIAGLSAGQSFNLSTTLKQFWELESIINNYTGATASPETGQSKVYIPLNHRLLAYTWYTTSLFPSWQGRYLLILSIFKFLILQFDMCNVAFIYIYMHIFVSYSLFYLLISNSCFIFSL